MKQYTFCGGLIPTALGFANDVLDVAADGGLFFFQTLDALDELLQLGSRDRLCAHYFTHGSLSSIDRQGAVKRKALAGNRVDGRGRSLDGRIGLIGA